MKLSLFNLLSALPILWLFAGSQSGAQTPQLQHDNHPRTASIGGRVTIGGAPAVNALVMVIEVDPKMQDVSSGDDSPQHAFVKIRTDGDGRYRVTGLAEGTYIIHALSKVYLRPKNSGDFNPSRTVTIDDGESRDNVNIALVRGGVITGRVIDAEGRPVIASSMRLFTVDEKEEPMREEFDSGDWLMMRTDDRGIYRIYGLPIGRYIIGAGGEWASNRARRKYPETFYPDAADANQAKIIEVKEGGEVTGIDIRLGVEKISYEAAGQVLDSETGQPLPQVSLRCMNVAYDGYGGVRALRDATTDDEGRFYLTGLSSGRYELSLWNPRGFFRPPTASMRNNEYYSKKSRFEVSDSDVSGLEIRAIRGSTLKGTVITEGVKDPAISATLQQMEVVVSVSGKRGSDGTEYLDHGDAIAKIAGDGGFYITGLAPGMASFDLRGSQENLFYIKRIERNGAEMRSDFEIRRGEQISGVRIVVGHGNGTIRGQVEITGGKLLEGQRLDVRVSPVSTTMSENIQPVFHAGNRTALADEKGLFMIESLAAGEYELSLYVMERTGPTEWTSVPGMGEFKQRVTVGSDVVMPVKFTLDLSRKQGENRQ